MERWLTFSFKDRESALISRRYGVPGFSSCCFTEIDVPIDLRWVSQGISGLWLSCAERVSNLEGLALVQSRDDKAKGWCADRVTWFRRG